MQVLGVAELGGAADGGATSRTPSLGLQLLICISKRSGKKVRPQFGHGSNASSFHLCVAASLYSSLLMPGCTSGALGTGLRCLAGFCASCALNFSSHLGICIAMEAVPKSRPQM